MTMTLKDISKKMSDIDFTMLTTRAADGSLASRPMSNNGDVEYDGDSFFFTLESTKTVKDIQRDQRVGLSLQGKGHLLGKPPLFISIEAQAELLRDKATFEKHWKKDLEIWFEKGIDTPGLVLIKAHAERITYWDGKEEGEVRVS